MEGFERILLDVITFSNESKRSCVFWITTIDVTRLHCYTVGCPWEQGFNLCSVDPSCGYNRVHVLILP